MGEFIRKLGNSPLAAREPICRSAAFGCGGSIPSLPTRLTNDDGPKGSSSLFQLTDERRLTRAEGN